MEIYCHSTPQLTCRYAGELAKYSTLAFMCFIVSSFKLPIIPLFELSRLSIQNSHDLLYVSLKRKSYFLILSGGPHIYILKDL